MSCAQPSAAMRVATVASGAALLRASGARLIAAPFASSSSVQSDLCVLNGTTSCTASPGAPPHRAVSCKAGMVTAVGSPQPRESRRSAYTRWTKSLHGRASFASTAGPATGRASDIRSGGAVGANPADTPMFLFFQVRESTERAGSD